MPELPDVAAFKRYFENFALGRKIASARVKDARIVRGLSAGKLEEELAGRTFISTRQHGKYLFAQTDGGNWLIEHFGMTGYLWYFEDPGDAPKYDRFLIRFESGGAISYANTRMLGWIGLTKTPESVIDTLGPSALEVGYNEFRKIFSGRKGGIKPALMDQKLIAGVGNVYSDEILFHAGVHPQTKIDALGQKELKSIFDSMKEVLRTAVERNGDIERLPRSYILRNRLKGAPCPACGNRLETVRIIGRTSYYCPHCQKSPDPASKQ